MCVSLPIKDFLGIQYHGEYILIKKIFSDSACTSNMKTFFLLLIIDFYIVFDLKKFLNKEGVKTYRRTEFFFAVCIFYKYELIFHHKLLQCNAPMVRILDGDSEIGAQVRSNIFYLICLRHLIRPRAVSNRMFFSLSCVRNMF